MAIVEGSLKGSFVARVLDMFRRDNVDARFGPENPNRRNFYLNGMGPFIYDAEGKLVDVRNEKGHSVFTPDQINKF